MTLSLMLNATFTLAGASEQSQEFSNGRRVWNATKLRLAYNSGDLTPTVVAKNVLKYMAESQIQCPGMSYFISCDVHDVLRQAEESTARYSTLHLPDAGQAA